MSEASRPSSTPASHTVITPADIAAMEKRGRVQFATSLPGVKPVTLVGSMDAAGHTNLAPFSSLVHLGSNPALLGFVTRPDTVERHTLSNILETGVYTLNHLHTGMVEAGHQCSARYPRGTSEFDATGLTPHIEDGFVFVAESRFRIGMKRVDTVRIEANGTQLVIGAVQCVHVAQGGLEADGRIDLARLGLVGSTALDTYYSISEFTRLPYAKPQSP